MRELLSLFTSEINISSVQLLLFCLQCSSSRRSVSYWYFCHSVTVTGVCFVIVLQSLVFLLPHCYIFWYFLLQCYSNWYFLLQCTCSLPWHATIMTFLLQAFLIHEFNPTTGNRFIVAGRMCFV